MFWWAAGLWLLWRVLNWRRDWFVATDKRFLLFYGFIRRKVAMMPLLKVTDVGDLEQRHHRDLAADEAVEQQEALVGGDEPVAPPVEHPPEEPEAGGPPEQEAGVPQQLPPWALRDLGVDPERQERCPGGHEDLADQVEPVPAHRDDDGLVGDEVALELAVEPRSARHVTR